MATTTASLSYYGNAKGQRATKTIAAGDTLILVFDRQYRGYTTIYAAPGNTGTVRVSGSVSDPKATSQYFFILRPVDKDGNDLTDVNGWISQTFEDVILGPITMLKVEATTADATFEVMR